MSLSATNNELDEYISPHSDNEIDHINYGDDDDDYDPALIMTSSSSMSSGAPQKKASPQQQQQQHFDENVNSRKRSKSYHLKKLTSVLPSVLPSSIRANLSQKFPATFYYSSKNRADADEEYEQQHSDLLEEHAITVHVSNSPPSSNDQATTTTTTTSSSIASKQQEVSTPQLIRLKRFFIIPFSLGTLGLSLIVLSLMVWLIQGIRDKKWFISLFSWTSFIIGFILCTVGTVVAFVLFKRMKVLKQEAESLGIQQFLKSIDELMANDINRNPNLSVSREIEKTIECLQWADSFSEELLKRHDLDLHIVHLQIWSRLAILYDRIEDYENSQKYTDMCERA